VKGEELAGLPGVELVEKGLADIRSERVTEFALLLQVAGPRLRALGIEIPRLALTLPFEHRLYELLEEKCGADAHSQYNALIRRIVSFARALESRQR
jgi:hypothetical protein